MTKKKTEDATATADEIIKGAEVKAAEIVAEAEKKAEAIIEAADGIAAETKNQAKESAAKLEAGVESSKEGRKFWMYKGKESRIFTEGEDIPDGWTDQPGGKSGGK